MKIVKSLSILCCLFLLNLSMLAQKPVEFITTETVKTTIKREPTYGRDRLFKIDQDRYLYVRGYYSYGILKSLQKLNVFLFNSDGKLISSNVDALKEKEMRNDYILDIVQHAGRVLVFTIDNEAKRQVCKFWDITDGQTPKKVKSIEIQKVSEYYPLPTLAISPDKGLMSIITGYAETVTLFDHELNTVYSRDIFKPESDKKVQTNSLQTFRVDDEGFVSLSVLFSEPTSLFSNKNSGSLFHVGVNTIDDNVSVWNLAEELKIGKYFYGGLSCEGLGSGRYLYSCGGENLSTGIFDLKSEEVIASDIITINMAVGQKGGKSDEHKIGVSSAHKLSNGKIALKVFLKDGDDGKSKFYVYDEQLNNMSTYDISWGESRLALQVNKCIGLGNEIFIPSFANEEDLNAIVGGKSVTASKDYSRAIPSIMILNLEGEKYEWFKIEGNPKIAEKNRTYIVTKEGIVGSLEFKGTDVTIHLNDLTR